MKLNRIFIALVGFYLPALGHTSDAMTYGFNGTFEEAKSSIEAAIINRGLVIDYVSQVGDMLNRTGADVGSDVKIFEAADVFQFCSAVLSRKVMEADPMNIAHCPYTIFVVDQGGEILLGYRRMPEGPMAEVEKLLDDIVQEAAEF
jgi:uncharacterized protein (DUF302 family)